MATNRFTDTIKADSERDALMQIYRLYPDADDITLTSRETASGERSANGRFFNFRIEMQQYDEFNDELLDGNIDLDEDEY